MEQGADFFLTKILPALVSLVAGLGWLFEYRKRRAEARRVEAEAGGIEVESRIKVEGAEVGHVGALLDRAEKLADKMLVYQAALLECQQGKKDAEIKVQEERVERESVERRAESLRIEVVELQKQVTDLNGKLNEKK